MKQSGHSLIRDRRCGSGSQGLLDASLSPGKYDLGAEQKTASIRYLPTCGC